MPNQPNEAARSALASLLKEHGLDSESRLFREAERTALESSGKQGTYRLAANAHPSESVIDVYAGPGYTVQAEEVGPGLAFAESTAPNWQETVQMRILRSGEMETSQVGGDRMEVEVRVGDILEQGGLMYPVESVEVERAWYFTLPAGSVEVREVTSRS